MAESEADKQARERAAEERARKLMEWQIKHAFPKDGGGKKK
jgi:hypothetical protein